VGGGGELDTNRLQDRSFYRGKVTASREPYGKFTEFVGKQGVEHAYATTQLRRKKATTSTYTKKNTKPKRGVLT